LNMKDTVLGISLLTKDNIYNKTIKNKSVVLHA